MAVRGVHVQRAHNLAAVEFTLPALFKKADALTVFFLWNRSNCRCATLLLNILPVSTRRLFGRTKISDPLDPWVPIVVLKIFLEFNSM